LSFGGVGKFDKNAEYFAYEADEYDRNFLSFYPEISIIPGIAYDHPDIYPTLNDYNDAFVRFLDQSNRSVLWQADADRIAVGADDDTTLLANDTDLVHITLAGRVNRINAHLAIVGLEKLGVCSYEQGVEIMNHFPGVSRRFEKITENLYTDYAHTPEKIRGALQLTREIAGDNVVVVYEGLHNTRQHFIKDELPTLFEGTKKLYIVPSYLAREDKSLEMLTPDKLCEIIKNPENRAPAELNSNLRSEIQRHIDSGDLVICLTAGGGGSLDEWLRREFAVA
jgi:UDP-N-acetylmuramate--alanine ligase